MTTVELDQAIRHKFTGEKITFLETNGDYEYLETFLPPGVEDQPLHYHRKFKEEIEVVEGELQVVNGHTTKIIAEGERLTIPKEVPHKFMNASNQKPVTFRVKMTPAHQFEESMRILYGLMEDGETDEKGFPNDRTHIALIFDMQDSHVVELPFILKLLMKRLVKKGKKKGIDQELIDKYAR